MKSKLIIGPVKSGKTSFVADYFIKNIDKNPVIITPTRESLFYLKKIIFDNKNFKGYFRHHLITFDHIVNSLLQDAAILNKANSILLIKNIVKAIHAKYFQPVINYEGFYKTIFSFMGELKSGEISPDVLRSGIQKKGANDKDIDILNIYSKYQQELLQNKVFDHEGMFWQAQKMIDSGNLGILSDCTILIVDGFYNFSPAELNLLKSISSHLEELIITLPMEKDIQEQYEPMDILYKNLKNIFKIDQEIKLNKKAYLPQQINIVSCPGEIREIEEIAREIKRLIIKNNYKPDQIAILCRNLDEYADSFINIFKDYQIPFYISSGLSLSKNALIKYLIKCFNNSEMPASATLSEFLSLFKKTIADNLSNIEIGNPENQNAIEVFLDSLENCPYYLIFNKNKQITINDFSNYLELTACSTENNNYSEMEGIVKILDVHKARGLHFPVVFICGLNENKFPQRYTEEPIYNDYERQHLKDNGVNVELSIEKQQEEYFLFNTAFKCSTEITYLSYSSVDLEGKEQLNSYYIDDVRNTYKDIVKNKHINLSYLIPDYDDIYSEEDLASRLLKDMSLKRIKNIAKELPDLNINTSMLYSNAILDDSLKFNINNSTITLNNIVIRNYIKQHFGPDYTFSISQLDEYALCPFVFFAKRILKIEAKEEEKDEILPKHEGTLYHNILRRYYLLAKNNPKIEISDVCKEEYANFEKLGLTRDTSLWGIKKNEILKNINKFLAFERDTFANSKEIRIPSYFEIAFGNPKQKDIDPSSNPKPLIIDNIKIMGIIDRIDVTGSGFCVVIDYKTGSTTITKNDIKNGIYLQLPVYMLAAKDVFNIGKGPSEGYLCYIKRKKHYKAASISRFNSKGAKFVESDKYIDIFNSVKQFIVAYVNAIRDCRFPARPKIECPIYCDFKGICRNYNTLL